MSKDILFVLTVFTGLFAVMNPIANLPVFLGLVEGADQTTKKQIARNGTITAFIIITCFIIFGKYIFELFHINIPSFKIAGGFLLFIVGFEMLQSKKPSTHSQDSIPVDTGVAISPLAIPILAGPGTIVTCLNYVTHVDIIHVSMVIGVFALMSFLTYLTFSFSEIIVKKLSNNLIAVIGKLMGLILTIMGTGMIVDGIKLAFNLS